MATANEVGKYGETLARQHLEQKGYSIQATNWRHGRAEIDIIAKQDEALIFVEVKTRSSADFGRPETFVSPQKAMLLAAAANAYMEEVGHDWEIRFDIISILLHADGTYQLDHLEDSFFPGLHD